MNNQQRELEASNPEQEEIEKLENQLREVATASSFLGSAEGKLYTQLIAKEVTALTKEITSIKFINDHQGYLECLGRLRQAQRDLRIFQVAGHPARAAKIQEKLDSGK